MIDDRTEVDVCVVGLGYIGLPTASIFGQSLSLPIKMPTRAVPSAILHLLFN